MPCRAEPTFLDEHVIHTPPQAPQQIPEWRSALVGQTLGGYRIIEKIGEGGMGSVFRAVDVGLERPAAIKVLPPSLAKEENFRARFLREARALARVKHPNLVQVYSVAADKGFHFFAMEFIEGESLAALIKRQGPLPLARILSVSGQILSALDAVHSAGITHRDVKSANIMLDKSGRAVLMDLGLAKDEASKGLTTAGIILGTPEYMSPEQAEGRPATPLSDIYSFGIVLYEMAAGTLPFRGKSAIAILRQQCEEEPPPLGKLRPDLPEAFVQAVAAALRKAPEERPQGAKALARMLAEAGPSGELETLVSGESLSRYPTLVERATGTTLELPRRRGNGALIAMAVLGAVIAIAAGLGWGWYMSRLRTAHSAPPERPKESGRPAAVFVAGEELFPGKKVFLVPGGVTDQYITVRLEDGTIKTIPIASRPELRYLEERPSGQ